MNKKINIEKIKKQLLNNNILDIQLFNTQNVDSELTSIESHEQMITPQPDIKCSDFNNEYEQFLYEQELIYKIQNILYLYINDYIDSKLESLNKPKSKRKKKN